MKPVATGGGCALPNRPREKRGCSIAGHPFDKASIDMSRGGTRWRSLLCVAVSLFGCGGIAAAMSAAGIVNWSTAGLEVAIHVWPAGEPGPTTHVFTIAWSLVAVISTTAPASIAGCCHVVQELLRRGSE